MAVYLVHRKGEETPGSVEYRWGPSQGDLSKRVVLDPGDPTARRRVGSPMEREPMTPDRWCWTTVLHEETGRPINVFIQASSTGAVVYSHRQGRWTVDAAMVARVSSDDEREGLTRLRATDRAGAEEAARQFGQTLPSDAELSRLLGARPAV